MKGNQAAYYWNSVREARQRVLQDPTLSIWQRSRILGELETVRAEANKPIPFGTMVRTLYNAGIVGGGAFLGSKLLGMSGAAQKTLGAAGFGLGTMWSLGSDKMKKLNGYAISQDAENAFKLGFLKAATGAGYFKESAAVLAVTPSDAISPVRAARQTMGGIAGGIGNIVGTAVSTSDDDLEVGQAEAEHDLMLQELARLRREMAGRAFQRLRRRR